MTTTTSGRGDILYSQRTGPWGRRMCWALLALLTIGGFVSSLDEGLGFALVSAAAYAVAWGIPVWIALLTLFSIDRYGKIELTRDTLRVGRTTIATTQIDVEDLLLQAREDDAAARRWAHVISATDLPAERVVGDAPMLGGSYGSTFGSAVLTIRVKDLGWRRVDVKRWADLLDGLLVVTTGQQPLVTVER